MTDRPDGGLVDPSEFNVFDPAIRADPYPLYRAMAARGPAFRNPALGIPTVIGHEEVQQVLRDPGTFSSAIASASVLDELLGADTMLFSDPPVHERLRSVVAPAFSKRTSRSLAPAIGEIAAHLLAPFGTGEVYDVVGAVADELPVVVIADLLGVPAADRADFRRWSDAAVAVGDVALTTTPAQREAMAELVTYFLDVIADRRERPGDDLVSMLVEANQAEVVDDKELVAACVLLLVAGTETTTNLIANLFLALASHPDQAAHIDPDDDATLAAAIEETLRFDPPVHAVVRTATTETQIADLPIGGGEMIMIMTAGANRDPSVFDAPDTYDVKRPDANRHVSFGFGIHHCIGAHLARLESREVLRVVRSMSHGVTLADPAAPLTYRDNFFLRGLTSLPVVADGARP